MPPGVLDAEHMTTFVLNLAPFLRSSPRCRWHPNRCRQHRQKSASISIGRGANVGTNAEENTNAEFVGAHCHSINVASLSHTGIKANIQLDLGYWSKHLNGHPVKTFVDFILNSIKYGVHIGYTGPLQL